MGCGKKRASFAYAGDLRHKAQSLVALPKRPFVARGSVFEDDPRHGLSGLHRTAGVGR